MSVNLTSRVGAPRVVTSIGDGPFTLITGGARSGKSSHAITLAITHPRWQTSLYRTAEALDDEMRARSASSRDAAAEFETIEAPLELVAH